jgi:hypothetical protein
VFFSSPQWKRWIKLRQISEIMENFKLLSKKWLSCQLHGWACGVLENIIIRAYLPITWILLMLINGIMGVTNWKTNSNELGHMNLLCLVTWPPLFRCHIASKKNRWEHISLISLSFLALPLSFHISGSLIGMINILLAGLQEILLQFFWQGDDKSVNFHHIII